MSTADRSILEALEHYAGVALLAAAAAEDHDTAAILERAGEYRLAVAMLTAPACSRCGHATAEHAGSGAFCVAPLCRCEVVE